MKKIEVDLYANIYIYMKTSSRPTGKWKKANHRKMKREWSYLRKKQKQNPCYLGRSTEGDRYTDC